METEKKGLQKKETMFGNIGIVGLALCSVAAGFLPQNSIVTLAIAALAVLLLVNDELHLLLPFVIFFNEWYGIFLGMSVQRIYSFLIIVLFLIRKTKTKSIGLRYLAPLAVYLLYGLFVMMQYNTQKAILSFVDVISCVILVSVFISKNALNLRRFFTAYVIAALCSLFVGILHNNVMVYGILSRFLATFEDPNYLGLFCTIAIFAMVSLRLFKIWVRIPLIALFYFAIIASASLSAIVVNILLWLVYVAFTGRIRLSTFVLCITAVAVCMSVYAYGLSHQGEGIVGQFVGRIEEALDNFRSGDIVDATTKRTLFAREHMEYFSQQPFLRKLFGGTAVNTSVIDPTFEAAAHNEFVDMLLNVGILGTVILLWFFAKTMWRYTLRFLRTKQEHYLCLLMLKCIWLLYGLTLTMFLDDRFMLLFFI